MPTLSVLIPNYNHGRYVAHCLDQIFSQDFPPNEVIVVDDGSTDDSAEIIARYASREPRLRFFRNPSNFGVMKTMNRALSLARGDYVYGGAADDWVAPRAFKKVMEMVRRYPGAGLCFGYVSQRHAGTGNELSCHGLLCRRRQSVNACRNNWPSADFVCSCREQAGRANAYYGRQVHCEV